MYRLISTEHLHKVAPTMNSQRRNSRRRSGKDTEPGPDKIRYSDIKKLTEEDRTELHTIYQESFDKGYIPEDWTDSILRPISKPGKAHHELNGYRIHTMQNTAGKLMERTVARKLARDLEDREILPENRGGGGGGGVQTRKMLMGKCSCICIWRVRRIPEERTSSGCSNRSRGCLQQSPVQGADGPAHPVGVSLTLTRWVAGELLERTVVMQLGNCQRPGRSEPKWTQQDSHTGK